MNVQAAYSFYKNYILDHSEEKSAIYKQYGFKLEGSIPFKDWEVFVAILMDDYAKEGNGTDLANYEVKSAVIGNSFEYQYHKDHGLDKLEDDKNVDHIFVVRKNMYLDIDVWLVNRSLLIDTFDKWYPEVKRNYESGERQRFRRSVSYNFVINKGTKILEIQDGRLVSL